MNKENEIIKIKNLSKKYKLFGNSTFSKFKDVFLPAQTKCKEFYALKKINLCINKGDVVGIIGRNGAGKSTLLKIISGITFPSEGSINVRGKIIPLLELGGGFNPDYTGRDNIKFYCTLQGMAKKEIDDIFQEIIDFAELGEFIDVPVKKYSSGMKSRLGFSVSIHIKPEILILDEVLSVGDELFRRKCYTKIEELFNSGCTVLYVSHNLQSVQNICNRVFVMKNGELVYDGETEEDIKIYREDSGDSILSGSKTISIQNTHYPAYVNNKYYDEKLVPKSLKLQAKKNISIEDCTLLDSQDKIVNLLTRGNKYKIKFRVKFYENVENVSVGVKIFTEKSNLVTGKFDQKKYLPIEQIRSNEIYDFSSEFLCLFNPGNYIIMPAVHGTCPDGSSGAIAVLRDAIFFKTLEVKDFQVGNVGLFND